MPKRPSALALDDEATWPQQLLQILEKGVPVLRAFCEEDARVERLGRDDLILRINPPDNPHRQGKNDVLVAARRALAGLSIVGWHCTRLCDDEVKNLKRDGMYTLTPETLAARVTRRVQAGDLSKVAGATFASSHKADDEHRQMLWFIFSKNLLRCEFGVRRLFTSWGGEALYICHEEDGHTGPVLRSIGKPCIVEAEIPIEIIDAHWEPEEWVARPFFHRRGINDGHDPERDGHIYHAIGPESIRRVISFDEPDFESLTGATKWRRPLL